MKTNKQSIKWLVIVLLALSFTACKKNKENEWQKKNEEIVEAIKKEELTKKIADIIPAQYQDTLTKLGIIINKDINPPSLSGGAYIYTPMMLFKSNRKEDPANLRFLDSRVKFFDQDADNNIKFIGKNLLNTADTSIVTAISGSGSQFTVYGKVKSVNGANSAIFAIVMSGSKDGNVLKDIRMGLINIDNSKGGTGVFIKQGEARVVFDTDKISETIAAF